MQKIDNIRFWQRLLKPYKVQQGGEDPLMLNSTVSPIIDIARPYIEDQFYVAVTNTDAVESTVFRKDQSFLFMGFTYYFQNTGALTATATISVVTEGVNPFIVSYQILPTGTVQANTFFLPTPILCKANTRVKVTTADQTGFYQLSVMGAWI